MRLSQNTEYAVAGALILYTVFISPTLPMIRQFMGSGVGTVLGLGVVYWVAKNVSCPLALIVLAVVLRCSSGMVREFMEATECPPMYMYDSVSKMCKKSGSPDIPPASMTPTPPTPPSPSMPTTPPTPPMA
jgi:hypothetical protein